MHDLVLQRGRVIDPESGHDGIGNIGVTRGRITAVSARPLRGRRVIDAEGLVVAPGWIDLHSHSHTVAGHRLQATDGVTTVLDLEAGVTPVADAYAAAAEEGRPLNFGYSASWALARMYSVGGLEAGAGMEAVVVNLGNPAWQGEASAAQRASMLELLRRDLEDGALGIGLLVGYAPRVDPREYVEVTALAASADVPTFTHARDLVEQVPDIPIDGAEELVRAAAETGTHMHYCHINSTSLRQLDRVLTLIERVRGEGARVSTEAYPYGAGMTAIGAFFLEPERLAARGLSPSSLVYAPTGERVADATRLEQLRASDPGGLAIVHFFDESDPFDADFVDRAILSPGTVIGSDAMPLTWVGGPAKPLVWPLPAHATTHPRTAGTFSKTFRRYVRERGTLSLAEAIARCSLMPAQVLESAVPSMRRKGRLRVGCDADIVAFDPDLVSDQSTYALSTRASTGYAYVMVNGVPVVDGGVLQLDALPGRAVRR